MIRQQVEQQQQQSSADPSTSPASTKATIRYPQSIPLFATLSSTALTSSLLARNQHSTRTATGSHRQSTSATSQQQQQLSSRSTSVTENPTMRPSIVAAASVRQKKVQPLQPQQHQSDCIIS
jgi:hypothetical protein